MRKQTAIIGVLTALAVIAGCNMAGQQKTYEPGELKLEPNEQYILTPKTPPEPRINGASVFGVRPGSPFLFTIAATGNRPLVFEAQGLPEGLTLDKQTGRITGKVQAAGTYNVTLKATNNLGAAERTLKIVVGDQIVLTPPMGWNSWNCWAANVSDKNVRSSAKAMIDSGLVNHGWTYINIDDTWQGSRGGDFNAIQGNKKFPDMKGLCDYVHSLGLKVGIYSTPWITSYAGYMGGSSDNEDGSWEKLADYERNKRFGKYAFDTNDAKQFAQWGIDYLKYDWHTNDEVHTERMANALRASGRDIVYSLSNSAPFDKAAAWAKLTNCWRTTGDIRDVWSKTQLPPNDSRWAQGVIDIWKQHERWTPFTGPGHWADADMLVVGKVGWGRPHPTKLTPDEQYTHISLWCLWSAPLLLGCPLDQLDEFTLNLLTNDEVLAVNQDPLGQQAKRIVATDANVVTAKDLEDGSKAVGLFNPSEETKKITVKFYDLGITGKQTVRDLWRQKTIGTYENQFEAMVRPHGVVLVRINP
ncbi:MAG: putative Ig domain-containing protein [Sedimentisphaerales bacterium]|nr:putative Ig domain-containing protein [Sedimentisphaerales bacterium]